MPLHATLGLILAGLAEMGAFRPIENWPYEKLFEKADLVVVARFVSSKDAGKVITDKPPEKGLVPMLSTCEILTTVKGEVSKRELVIVHYRLEEGVTYVNGPVLASFHSRKMRIETGSAVLLLDPPEYLLFLRKRADGRFECVSGQFDSGLSVKQVLSPLP